MLYRPIIYYVCLTVPTENIHVTGGHKYFPRRPGRTLASAVVANNLVKKIIALKK